MLQVGGDFDLVQEPVSPITATSSGRSTLTATFRSARAVLMRSRVPDMGCNYAAAESLPRVDLVRYQGSVGVS